MLTGKRVLVTRASDQASDTARKLRDRGAIPVEIPTIVLEPPTDRAPLLDAARAFSASASQRWDVVAFTSPNAVDALVAAMHDVGVDPRALDAKILAAIGPSTERALHGHRLQAKIVPREHRGEALAEAIVAHGAKRVLVPRAEIAREALVEGLRAAGVEVDVVVAYRSRPPNAQQIEALRRALDERAVDAVLFTAGSTVDNLCARIEDAPRVLSRLVVASIGPVTSEACRARGVRVDVEATSASIDALLDAIDRFFSRENAKP